jgi:hypothetical protein
MKGTAELAVAAATITPAEGRAAAAEAPGEAILAVHSEPRRVSPHIQLTSSATPRVGRQGPERLVRIQLPSPSTGCRAAERPPDQVAADVAARESAARYGCRDRRLQLLIHKVVRPMERCARSAGQSPTAAAGPEPRQPTKEVGRRCCRPCCSRS